MVGGVCSPLKFSLKSLSGFSPLLSAYHFTLTSGVLTSESTFQNLNPPKGVPNEWYMGCHCVTISKPNLWFQSPNLKGSGSSPVLQFHCQKNHGWNISKSHSSCLSKMLQQIQRLLVPNTKERVTTHPNQAINIGACPKGPLTMEGL